LKVEKNCDESQLVALMQELARELSHRSGSCWILLEGPLGAGKSTAARALIQALDGALPPEGSPTFALAHEYVNRAGREIIHLDLYRLDSLQEVEAAGVPAYFWERPGAIVISEWTSKFPALEESLTQEASCSLWRVDLQFKDSSQTRQVRIQAFCS